MKKPEKVLTMTQFLQWIKGKESTEFWEEMYQKYSDDLEKYHKIEIDVYLSTHVYCLYLFPCYNHRT